MSYVRKYQKLLDAILDPSVRLTRFDPNRLDARELDRLLANFFTEATVSDGVVRWKSNNSVPPKDILDLWHHVGFAFDIVKSKEVSDNETTAFLTAYRERMKDYVPSSEEMFEMRSAFGEGATVVNVITGQKTKL